MRGESIAKPSFNHIASLDGKTECLQSCFVESFYNIASIVHKSANGNLATEMLWLHKDCLKNLDWLQSEL